MSMQTTCWTLLAICWSAPLRHGCCKGWGLLQWCKVIDVCSRHFLVQQDRTHHTLAAMLNMHLQVCEQLLLCLSPDIYPCKLILKLMSPFHYPLQCRQAHTTAPLPHTFINTIQLKIIAGQRGL